MDILVGFCPMGCGQTLFVGEGGHVTCSYVDCPRPTAVDELLSDGDTRHVAKIEATGFTIEHPVKERLDGGLFECNLHAHIRQSDGPPVEPGYYFCWLEDGEVKWEPTQRPG